MFSFSILLIILLPRITIPTKLGFACCVHCWPLCHPGLFGYVHEKVVKTVQRCREEARKERKRAFVASWRFGWKHRKSCSAGCCLILMHCGSSPLVNLLTQSCHWVTATAHYSFLFWPEPAESCQCRDLAPATLTLASKEVKPCWLLFKVRCDKEKKKKKNSSALKKMKTEIITAEKWSGSEAAPKLSCIVVKFDSSLPAWWPLYKVESLNIVRCAAI